MRRRMSAASEAEVYVMRAVQAEGSHSVPEAGLSLRCPRRFPEVIDSFEAAGL